MLEKFSCSRCSSCLILLSIALLVIQTCIHAQPRHCSFLLLKVISCLVCTQFCKLTAKPQPCCWHWILTKKRISFCQRALQQCLLPLPKVSKDQPSPLPPEYGDFCDIAFMPKVARSTAIELTAMVHRTSLPQTYDSGASWKLMLHRTYLEETI